MRIVYLHQYFTTPDQAGGVRSFHMANALAERGHDVHVVTADTARMRPSSRAPRTTLVGGVTVHSLAVPYDNAMSFGDRMKAFATFAVRASGLARSLRGDVVLATSTPLTIAVPAMIARAGRRTPMVFEVRDVWPELPIAMGALRNPVLRLVAHALERAAYRSSASIIALSEGMKAGVARAGYPASRVEVITNVSDTATFAPSASHPDRFLQHHPELRGRDLIVYCGTFGMANDIGYLVDVAVAARKAGSALAFVAVGTGAESASVRERAERTGVLDDNLFLLGPVAKSDLPDVLASARIVLSLFAPIRELEDNSANKFFDALAAEKPVAINYGGWQADVLARSGAGIRLPRDPHRAAESLRAAVADPEFLQAASVAAAELAGTEFCLERLTRRFCDVVEAVRR